MATRKLCNAISVAEDGVERLRDEIREKRNEIKIKFAEFRDSLDKKENDLLDKLDCILEKVSQPLFQRKSKIEQLEEGTAAVEAKLQHNEFHNLRCETISSIEREIKVLENKDLNEIPSARLKWNVDLMERALLEVCQITEGLPPYSERRSVVMSCGTRGKGKEDLSTPTGIAIDGENGDMYVADCHNHRIQVFSKQGKHKSTIADLGFPRRLIVDSSNIFVTCNIEGGAMFQINKHSPDERTSFPEGDYVSDITCDHHNRIVGCVYAKPLVFFWDKKLSKVQEVILHTSHYETGTTKAQKIVATPNALYVLFTNCDYPLQSFEWSGYVQKPILFQDELSGAKMFCRDPEGNFIIVNNGNHEIRIFTPDGKVSCTIGEREGQFSDPLSVDITRGRIVVLDMKETNMLQIF